MAYNHIRVLTFPDNTCILFNTMNNRISGKAPGFVGRAALRFAETGNLDEAFSGESGFFDLFKGSAIDLLLYIAGTEDIVKPDMSVKELKNVLILCPSNTCPLHCVYCSGNAGAHSRKLMDWDLAKAAIDYYIAHPRIGDNTLYNLKFHGAGEPMTNAGIVKKSIEYARALAEKNGCVLQTVITTNGYYPEETARWMAENLTAITVSLDGPPDIHNAQRPVSNGGQSYDTVLRSLKIFEEKGVLRQINAVVTELGIDRMEEILRHFRSISRIGQLRLLPMEYSRRCETSDISAIDAARFSDNLEKLIPAAASLGFSLRSTYEDLGNYRERYCAACGYMFCVSPEGNISSCQEVMNELSGAPELLTGKYADGQIRLDWEQLMRLRGRTYHVLEPCKKCPFRTNCAGTCPVRAARKNGTVFSVDAEACERHKRFLTRYLVNRAESLGE